MIAQYLRVLRPVVRWLLAGALVDVSLALGGALAQEPADPQAAAEYETQDAFIADMRSKVREVEASLAREPTIENGWSTLISYRSMLRAAERARAGAVETPEEAEAASRAIVDEVLARWRSLVPNDPGPSLFYIATRLPAEQRLDALRQLARQHPTDEQVSQRLLGALHWHGLEAEITEWLEGTLARGPRPQARYRDLYQHHQRGGRTDAADRVLDDWLAAFPDDASAQDYALSRELRGLSAAEVDQLLVARVAAVPANRLMPLCQRLSHREQQAILLEAAHCFQRAIGESTDQEQTARATGDYATLLGRMGDWQALERQLGALDPAQRERVGQTLGLELTNRALCAPAALVFASSVSADQFVTSANPLTECVRDASFQPLLARYTAEVAPDRLTSLLRRLGEDPDASALLLPVVHERLAREPASRGLNEAVAMLYRNTGDSVKLLEHLEAWLAADPELVGEPFCVFGQLLWEQKGPQAAIAWLHGRFEQSPEEWLARDLVAAHLASGGIDRAEAVAQRLLEQEGPSRFAAHRMMAEIAFARADARGAIQHYEEYFRSAPDPWQHAADFVAVLSQTSDDQRLQSFLEQWWQELVTRQREPPGKRDLWLGEQLAWAGRLEQAAQAYERAAAGPHAQAALEGLARIGSDPSSGGQAQTSEASQSALERLLASNPQREATWLDLAELFAARGDFASAFATLRRALATLASPSPRLFIVWSDLALGEHVDEPAGAPLETLIGAIRVLRSALDRFRGRASWGVHERLEVLYRVLGAKSDAALWSPPG